MNLSCLFLACLSLAFTLAAEPIARLPDETLPLWSGPAPGSSSATGPEQLVTGRPRPFFQLTEITNPSLAVFLPPAHQRIGSSMLVVPGGGMQRLAYEHEGLEVAHWLNSIGISAFVLKYRVPAPAFTGLLDAQRAMGLIRSNAARWGLDPDSLGFIGFSAGGEIGAWLVTHAAGRNYPASDAADQLPCRPDFAAFIYPGGLLQRGGGLKDPFASNLNTSLPPLFLAHAFDDASENSLQLALALKRARVPTEFHLFHQGAHGFGAREIGGPANAWKSNFTNWLGSLGHMDPPPVRDIGSEITKALLSRSAAPALSLRWPQANLSDAYTVQRRVVRAFTNRVVGYKGAGASAEAQATLGIDGPLTAVLFQNGRINHQPDLKIERAAGEQLVVETEIGYVMGVDFSFHIPTDAHARDAVAAVVPVIELPGSFPGPAAPPDARNMVAANIGSGRFIVGNPIAPGSVDPDSWPISLSRDGAVLHQTTGSSAKGGQWHNLRSILNQLTAQGYVIRQGDIILCGALGKIQPGQPGNYEARFGNGETISFELR